MRNILVLTGFAVSLVALGGPTLEKVMSVESEALRLERQLSDVRAENRILESKCEALTMTADLIAGRRSMVPSRQVVEKPVLSLCEQPETLDNRTSGKAKVYSKSLKLSPARRYRVRARLEIGEISGTKNFKFGAMVTQPGKSPAWPAARIGGQAFAEKDVYFDFFFPEEGKALLLLGFETGKGLATFRDVRILELTEELK